MNKVIYLNSFFFLYAITFSAQGFRSECGGGCSGHGACLGGLCACDHEWVGHDCSFRLSDTTELTPWAETHAAVHPLDLLQRNGCPQGCEEGATCISGVCHCPVGLFGAACSDSQCPGNCGGRGSCAYGQCQCHPGWGGSQCTLSLGDDLFQPTPVNLFSAFEQQHSLAERSQTAGPLNGQHQMEASGIALDAQTLRYRQDVGDRGHSVLEEELLMLEREEPQTNLRSLEQSVGTRVSQPKKLTLYQAQARAEKKSSHKEARPPREIPKQGSSKRHLLGEKRRKMSLLQAEASADQTNQENQSGHASATQASQKEREVRQRALEEFSKRQEQKFTASMNEMEEKRRAMQAEEESERDARRRIDRAVAAAHGVAETLVGSEFGELPGESNKTSLSVIGVNVNTSECAAGCGEHGTCVEDSCRCDAGWFGDECESLACEGDCQHHGMCLKGSCLCEPSFLGADCGTARCEDDCNGHGSCFSGVCGCSDGYEGPSCAKEANLTCPQDCSGHGTCDSKTGTCDCHFGYHGAACDQHGGFCGSHGSQGGGFCLCHKGWSGSFCGIELLCADPTCSGHGVCAEGTCRCGTGYSGHSCAVLLEEKVKVSTHLAARCPGGCGGHGTCQAGVCICNSGFEGRGCEVALRHSSSVVGNVSQAPAGLDSPATAAWLAQKGVSLAQEEASTATLGEIKTKEVVRELHGLDGLASLVAAVVRGGRPQTLKHETVETVSESKASTPLAQKASAWALGSAPAREHRTVDSHPYGSRAPVDLASVDMLSQSDGGNSQASFLERSMSDIVLDGAVGLAEDVVPLQTVPVETTADHDAQSTRGSLVALLAAAKRGSA